MEQYYLMEIIIRATLQGLMWFFVAFILHLLI